VSKVSFSVTSVHNTRSKSQNSAQFADFLQKNLPNTLARSRQILHSPPSTVRHRSHRSVFGGYHRHHRAPNVVVYGKYRLDSHKRTYVRAGGDTCESGSSHGRTSWPVGPGGMSLNYWSVVLRSPQRSLSPRPAQRPQRSSRCSIRGQKDGRRCCVVCQRLLHLQLNCT
jgi:hypothetical protein